jgi:glutaminyl-peptide cyclotransferase
MSSSKLSNNPDDFPGDEQMRKVPLTGRAFHFTASVLLLLATLRLGGCGERAEPEPEAPLADSSSVEQLSLGVRQAFPHDTTSFTQGLFLHPDGTLIESVGNYGSSAMLRVDLETGEILHSVPLDSIYFGEGCCLHGDTIYQLTWKERVVLLYDTHSLEQIGQLDFETDGWGICSDGNSLIVSDGTSYLYYRQPGTFALEDRVQVTYQGRPLHHINEMEYVEGAIYANVWRSDYIYRIDPETGEVTGLADATDLRDASRSPWSDVLNGIAWIPDSETFIVTGKLWPLSFEVRIGRPGEE